MQIVENVNFTPNEVLVETLFNALGEYKDEIKKQIKQAENGMEVTLPEKRMAVLNALPAPLSEPIRNYWYPWMRILAMIRSVPPASDILKPTPPALTYGFYHDGPTLGSILHKRPAKFADI